jgi:hypothetical protein
MQVDVSLNTAANKYIPPLKADEPVPDMLALPHRNRGGTLSNRVLAGAVGAANVKGHVLLVGVHEFHDWTVSKWYGPP